MDDTARVGKVSGLFWRPAGIVVLECVRCATHAGGFEQFTAMDSDYAVAVEHMVLHYAEAHGIHLEVDERDYHLVHVTPRPFDVCAGCGHQRGSHNPHGGPCEWRGGGGEVCPCPAMKCPGAPSKAGAAALGAAEGGQARADAPPRPRGG